MQSFTKRQAISVALVVFLVFGVGWGSFQYGYHFGESRPKTILVENLENAAAGKPDIVDFGTFWQAWQLIDSEYLKADEADSQERVYGAIRGLLASLNDPYSGFFDPVDNKKFQEDIRGNFSGIGAEIGFREKQLTVIAPLKNTPASRAGLLGGDAILKIDDAPTDGLTIDKAVNLIRGEKYSKVTLLISRETWEEPKEITIVRDDIVAPTLDFEIKEGDIGYIKLYSFNANTLHLFSQAAIRILGGELKGIVLDLRGNPGGYLDTAVDLSGWFLPENTLIVKEEGREKKTIEEFRAKGPGVLSNIPLVILINKGSASASEIVAGTLRDNRNIKLIGEQSFGKGTVQELKTLRDNSSLKLTIAHWVLPSGTVLEGEGLTPDVVIEMPEIDSEDKRDLQLEKAIEVLRQEITTAQTASH